MEMSIDEAIKELKHIKALRCVLNEENIIALEMAIDTMHKYQKIQEIINNTDYIQEDVIRYKMICGVVKDGNVD